MKKEIIYNNRLLEQKLKEERYTYSLIAEKLNLSYNSVYKKFSLKFPKRLFNKKEVEILCGLAKVSLDEVILN